MKQTAAVLIPVEAMTPAEALMTVAVLAMAGLHPLFRDTANSADRFIGQRFADLRARGRVALVEETHRALSPRLRETAYAWVAELVCADGSVTAKERAFLDDLARRFEVPGPLARKIQAVIAIMRRTT